MAKMTNTEVRKLVSEKVAECLESGVNPWSKPWDTIGPNLPYNPAGKYGYRGVNIPYLMAVAAMNGWPNLWVSYKQAMDLGGNVRKGEKAGAVTVFAKPLKVKAKDGEKADEDGKKTIFMLKARAVFNVAQCEGLEDLELPEPRDIEGAQEIMDVLKEAGAEVTYGGDRAFYAPGPDRIGLPAPEQFKTLGGFAGTALHELVHWTGHQKRLARPGIVDFDGFGSEQYAREELVAEFGAAMLCFKLGIRGELENHASYLKSWAKAIREDEKVIFRAAGMAEKACDYIMPDEALAKAA